MGEILEVEIHDVDIRVLKHFGGKVHGHSKDLSEIELPDDWVKTNHLICDKYNRHRSTLITNFLGVVCFNSMRRFTCDLVGVTIPVHAIYERYVIGNQVKRVNFDAGCGDYIKSQQRYLELLPLYKGDDPYQHFIAYWGKV